MTHKTVGDGRSPNLTFWHQAAQCCDGRWEQAYEDFETPDEEIEKFLRRYRKLHVTRWPRDWEIVELFCGRGNGLVALARLGFERLEGVDLSSRLLGKYQGPARLYVGDCRDLKFEGQSKDAVVVQGGLHHLQQFPDDLVAAADQIRRVLRIGGRFVLVEPWSTPFLAIVHFLSKRRLSRSLSPKLDAFARMTEREIETYSSWLSRPAEILSILRTRFQPRQCSIGWGKLMFEGIKESA